MPDWKILHRSLEAYRQETRRALEQLSVALEVSLQEQQACDNRFTNHLRNKIERLANIYEADLEVLQQHIFVPFPATKALLAKEHASEQHPSHVFHHEKNQEHGFTWSATNRHRIEDQHQPYNSARQVIAHMVRDWSAEGASSRSSLYSWCVRQVQRYQPNAPPGPVLVPGAGLGRLAWELAIGCDCSVEAIESSVSMVSAAYAILNDSNPQKSAANVTVVELHPYTADLFTNEIDSSARYDVVSIPDVVPTIPARKNGHLSYTLCEFNYQNLQQNRNVYSSVVTCFFLDTATTLHDYLTTIDTILAADGVWINVGPVQWHQNSKVPVAVDELRMILEDFCDALSGKPVFRILQWSVDEQHVNYRDDRWHRSTHLDAYYPLRFVLRKLKH
jgi:hypothetical protein